MPKVFTVTKIFSFTDDEIPAEFTFQIPQNGDYEFIQDEEHVYVYIEGDIDEDVKRVEARLLVEGDAIPDGFRSKNILAAYTEEGDVTWALIVVKSETTKSLQKSNSWKKTF